MALIQMHTRLVSSSCSKLAPSITRGTAARFPCRAYGKQTFSPHRSSALPRVRETAYSMPSRAAVHATRLGKTRSYADDAVVNIQKWANKRGPDGPDLNLKYVEIPGKEKSRLHPTFLRDACTCPRCVDPSTTQKTFQTTDIPKDIIAKEVKSLDNGDLEITWSSSFPDLDGPNHVSTFPASFFESLDSEFHLRSVSHDNSRVFTWNNIRVKGALQFVNYEDYMSKPETVLHTLHQLKTVGLVLLRGVPEQEKAVEDIASRVGLIRETFYGRTWDVKSVPDAKNVAYTQQSIGLHQDLLYMQNPPGFQLLHCLKNTCEGGDSIFSDGLFAAGKLSVHQQTALENNELAYHYKNDGQYYYFRRPVIEVGRRKLHVTEKEERSEILNINYSPPFQATLPFSRRRQGWPLPSVLDSLRRFAAVAQYPANVFEYKLQPGECVVFDNRRILHGRKAFDSAAGERWLKGTYIDTDVLNNKYRTLLEAHGPMARVDNPETKFVFPEVVEHRRLHREKIQAEHVKKAEAAKEAAAKVDDVKKAEL